MASAVERQRPQPKTSRRLNHLPVALSGLFPSTIESKREITSHKPTSRYLSDEVAGSDLALMLPGNLIRDPGSETAWVACVRYFVVLGNALGNRGD